MPKPPKTRLTVAEPVQLLEELTAARAALKRSRGAKAPSACPALDSLIVQLHVAVAATASLLTPPAAHPHV